MQHTREYIYVAALLHDIASSLPAPDPSSADIHELARDASSCDITAEQQSLLAEIIDEARQLSLGLQTDASMTSPALLPSAPGLIPITATIGRDATAADTWRQPPVAVTLSEDFLPKEKLDGYKQGQQRLQEAFWEALTHLNHTRHAGFTQTLLSLLYTYTSTLPVSEGPFQDVSLYDHAKTTAALALCLYDVKASGERPEAPFLLIGADLSGIQAYIYQIVSKYAAKNLKGRSFYLRLLTDAVVRYLLHKLGLFEANLIYNSGGGFYLLAPNTSAIRSALADAIPVIERQIFDTHGTTLFLAIDSIPLSRDALTHADGADLGEVWGALFDKKEKKKYARYSTLIQNEPQRFFSPFQNGGEERTDIVTGEYFAPDEPECNEKGLKPIRQITRDQIRLGQTLKDSDVMVVSTCPLPFWADKTHLEPIHLGLHYYFIQQADLIKAHEALTKLGDSVRVVTFNRSADSLSRLIKEGCAGLACSMEFYGGNGTSRNLRYTFEEMCDSLTADAFERLGVLRMDVDNLGHIFQQGIPADRATLSRMTALSRSFDYFFSGYLNTLWREVAPERTFIIYSGGDDLFIVGSWDATIRLAERIHTVFRRFTCNNPAFSISGGIAIVDAKFPIIKGAEMSATEEGHAKEHTCGGTAKNSLSLLGMALNFDQELPPVQALKTRIASRFRDQDISKSFIQKVLRHYENADIKAHIINNVKTYWMMVYDLSRMENRLPESAKSLISSCKSEVCTNLHTLGGQPITSDYHPLEFWALACRWAELELRTDND